MGANNKPIDGENLKTIEEFLRNEHWINTRCISPTQHIDNTLHVIIPITSRIHKDQSPIGNINFDVTTFHSSSLSQLTPPQSPVNSTTSVQQASSLHLIDPQDVHNQTEIVSSPRASIFRTSYAEPFVQNEWNANNPVQGVSTFYEEIERETQIVDEIVNTRAKELIDWNDDSESMSSVSPPSMQSMFDEEFLPYSSSMTASSSSTCSPLHTDEGDCLQSKSTPTIPKRRTRFYGRGVQDRKIRKKEQNKNAATRYRQKKKQEMECVLSEEQQLTNQNDELKKILADRKREAKYLKTLIREFYKKKP